jgi:hypothetical protein
MDDLVLAKLNLDVFGSNFCDDGPPSLTSFVFQAYDGSCFPSLS